MTAHLSRYLPNQPNPTFESRVGVRGKLIKVVDIASCLLCEPPEDCNSALSVDTSTSGLGRSGIMDEPMASHWPAPTPKPPLNAEQLERRAIALFALALSLCLMFGAYWIDSVTGSSVSLASLQRYLLEANWFPLTGQWRIALHTLHHCNSRSRHRLVRYRQLGRMAVLPLRMIETELVGAKVQQAVRCLFRVFHNEQRAPMSVSFPFLL